MKCETCKGKGYLVTEHETRFTPWPEAPHPFNQEVSTNYFSQDPCPDCYKEKKDG